MADQVRDKRLEGISDIRDETDRNGMRIVIELKKDANAQVVLNRLFAQTQMQTTFGVTMLALVNNQTQPKILSLRHMLDEYLAFQEEIITRRTQYDLKKALDRQHVLEGLLIAEENIDAVIKTIRESYDDAKERLMERFNLSEMPSSFHVPVLRHMQTAILLTCNLENSSSSRSKGSLDSRSILLINVKIGIWRIAQTLNSFRVCGSTPFAPSMTMTAESAAMSVR